jgi:hypothetical protein
MKALGLVTKNARTIGSKAVQMFGRISQAQKTVTETAIDAARRGLNYGASLVGFGASSALDTAASWAVTVLNAPIEAKSGWTSFITNIFSTIADWYNRTTQGAPEQCQALIGKMWRVLTNPSSVAEALVATGMSYDSAAWKMLHPEQKGQIGITLCSEDQFASFLKFSPLQRKMCLESIVSSGLWDMDALQAAQFHTAIEAWTDPEKLTPDQSKEIKDILRKLYSIFLSVQQAERPSQASQHDKDVLDTKVSEFTKLVSAKQNDILFLVSTWEKNENTLESYRQELKKLQTGQEYDKKTIEQLVAAHLKLPSWTETRLVTPQDFEKLDKSVKLRLVNVVRSKVALFSAERSHINKVRRFLQGTTSEKNPDDISLTLRLFNRLQPEDREKMYDFSGTEILQLHDDHKRRFLKSLQNALPQKAWEDALQNMGTAGLNYTSLVQALFAKDLSPLVQNSHGMLKKLITLCNRILPFEVKSGLRKSIDQTTDKIHQTIQEIDTEIQCIEKELASPQFPPEQREEKESLIALLKQAREAHTSTLTIDQTKLQREDLANLHLDDVYAPLHLQDIAAAIGSGVVTSGIAYRLGQISGPAIGTPIQVLGYMSSFLPWTVGKMAGTRVGHVVLSFLVAAAQYRMRQYILSETGKKRMAEYVQSASGRLGFDWKQDVERRVAMLPATLMNLANKTQEIIWENSVAVRDYIDACSNQISDLQKQQELLQRTGGASKVAGELETQKKEQQQVAAQATQVVYEKKAALPTNEGAYQDAKTLMTEINSQKGTFEFRDSEETQQKKAAVHVLEEQENKVASLQTAYAQAKIAEDKLHGASWFTTLLANHGGSVQKVWENSLKPAWDVTNKLLGAEIALCNAGIKTTQAIDSVHWTVMSAVDTAESKGAEISEEIGKKLATVLGAEESSVATKVAGEVGANLFHTVASLIPTVSSIFFATHPLLSMLIEEASSALIAIAGDKITENFSPLCIQGADALNWAGRKANEGITTVSATAGTYTQRLVNWAGKSLANTVTKFIDKGYWIDKQRIQNFDEVLNDTQRDAIYQTVTKYGTFTAEELATLQKLHDDPEVKTNKEKREMFITILLLGYDTITIEHLKNLTVDSFLALSDPLKRRILHAVKTPTKLTPKSIQELVECFNALTPEQKKDIDIPTLDEFEAIPENQQKEIIFQIVHSKAYQKLPINDELRLSQEALQFVNDPELPLPSGADIKKLLKLYPNLDPIEFRDLTPQSMEKLPPSRLVRMYEYLKKYKLEQLNTIVNSLKLDLRADSLLAFKYDSPDIQEKKHRLIVGMADLYRSIDLSREKKGGEFLCLTEDSVRLMKRDECLAYINGCININPEQRDTLILLAKKLDTKQDGSVVAKELTEIFNSLPGPAQVAVHSQVEQQTRTMNFLGMSAKEKLSQIDARIVSLDSEKTQLKQQIKTAEDLFEIAENTKTAIEGKEKLQQNLKLLRQTLVLKEQEIKFLFDERKPFASLVHETTGTVAPPAPNVAYTALPENMATNICEVLFRRLENKMKDLDSVEDLQKKYDGIQAEVEDLKTSVNEQLKEKKIPEENAKDFLTLIAAGQKRLQATFECIKDQLSGISPTLGKNVGETAYLQAELSAVQQSFEKAQTAADLDKTYEKTTRELTAQAIAEPEKANGIEKLRWNVSLAYQEKKRASFTPTYVLIEEFFHSIGQNIKRAWKRFVTFFSTEQTAESPLKGKRIQASPLSPRKSPKSKKPR